MPSNQATHEGRQLAAIVSASVVLLVVTWWGLVLGVGLAFGIPRPPETLGRILSLALVFLAPVAVSTGWLLRRLRAHGGCCLRVVCSRLDDGFRFAGRDSRRICSRVVRRALWVDRRVYRNRGSDGDSQLPCVLIRTLAKAPNLGTRRVGASHANLSSRVWSSGSAGVLRGNSLDAPFGLEAGAFGPGSSGSLGASWVPAGFQAKLSLKTTA